MRVDSPPFAGPDSPPPFATAAAAAFGAATLAAAAFSASGPDAVKAVLARGDARAALSILFASALPCAVALAVAFAAASKPADTSGGGEKRLPDRLRAMLRTAPRGSVARGAEASLFLLGAAVVAPALAMLSVPIGLALEAIGVVPEPQFAAIVLNGPETGPFTRLALALSVTVLSPFAEEILYRALLWQGLCAALRRRFPDGAARSGRRFPDGGFRPGWSFPEGAAAVACALFFAALHASVWAFLPLVLFALALSAVYRRFTLGSAIAFHAGFNAGGCLLALLV